MITGHVWRPPHNFARGKGVPPHQWPCEYMNCRRPRIEHERDSRGRVSR